MIKIKYIFLLAFLCTSHAASFSQQSEIDSLSNLLQNAPEDTFKVNTLNSLSDKIWQRGDYKKAMTLAQEGRALANKINFKKGEATAFINLALIYWKQGEYPGALGLTFKALKINEEINYKKGIARSFNLIGLIYFNQENYEGALDYYKRALKIREEIGDRQSAAGSLSNIGEVYQERGDYENALVQYLNALKINEEEGNKNWAAVNINNIGKIYYIQGQNAPANEQLDYYEKAFREYLKALKIREEIGDKQGIARSYLSIGLVNVRMKKNQDAKKYFTDALLVSKSIGYKEGIKDSYFSLSDVDRVSGNWKDAYEHQRLYIVYRDSLISEENIRKSVRLEMNFAFERKEQEIKLEQEKKDVIVEQEKQKQRIVIASVSGGLVIVLILAIVILRSLRRNQKQNKIILAQKELVEKQKRIVDEKQKEISDSINYAERIQRSFLATEHLLSENLKEYFVFFRPKDVVSGDFYWASKLSNNQFAIVTADSTGHGVPGAIMSILNISCLEKSVEEKQLTEPSEILNYTRTKIIERLKKDGSAEGGKDGMDCSLMSFDFNNNQLIYSAANNPIWIVRNNKQSAEPVAALIEFAPDKMPVGRHDRDNMSFTQHTVLLKKGDMVYAITDGMPDQFGGPRGKKFMYKQLKELLISIASLPMPDQKKRLNKEFINWKGDLEQVDDVCIIGIRI